MARYSTRALARALHPRQAALLSATARIAAARFVEVALETFRHVVTGESWFMHQIGAYCVGARQNGARVGVLKRVL
jgi:hypothetical protein